MTTRAERAAAIEAAAHEVTERFPGTPDMSPITRLRAALDLKVDRWALFLLIGGHWVEQHGFNEYDSERSARDDAAERLGTYVLTGDRYRFERRL